MRTKASAVPSIGDLSVHLTEHAHVVAVDIEGYRATTWEDVCPTGAKKAPFANKISRVVCSTWYGRGRAPAVFGALFAEGRALLRQGADGWTALVDRSATERALAWALNPENDVVLCTLNGLFDFSNLLHTYRRTSPHFAYWHMIMLAECRWAEAIIREKLLAVAEGWAEFEPNPETGRPMPTRFNLAAMVKRYFAFNMDGKTDGWRLNYHKLDGVPLAEWPADAVNYAMDDAKWTLAVVLEQGRHARLADTPHGYIEYVYDHGGVHGEVFQLRKAWTLYLGSIWSVRADPVWIERWRIELEEAEIIKQAALAELGVLKLQKGGKVSVIESKLRLMVKEDLIASGRWDEARHLTDPSKTFPEGQIAIGGDVLLQCTHPAILRYASVKKASKEASTYFKPISNGTRGPIAYSYDYVKESGRTSAFDMNVQNFPREGIKPKSPSLSRESIIPRAGDVFCSCDFTGAELCALGQNHLWAFDESALADTINAGIDPHAPIAAELWGVTLEEFLSRYSGTQGEELFKLAKFVYRQTAKAANFGRPGGLRAPTFVDFCASSGLDLYEIAVASGKAEPTEREGDRDAIRLAFAEHVLEAYDRAIPESPRFMEIIQDFCQESGHFAMTEDGRRRPVFNVVQPVSGRVRGLTGYNAACNTYFQGLVADVGSEALWRLGVACYLPPEEAVDVFRRAGTVWPTLTQAEVYDTCAALYGCRPVLWIHDESILSGPEATAHEWAHAQSRVMEESGRVFIPDVIMPAHPALMRRWYKAAEPVYVNGILVPWEPKK